MSKQSIHVAAVAFVGISLIAIGAIAVVAPETAASMFGVPVTSNETRAYVWAAGGRDIAIGSLFLVFLALRVNRRVLGASLLVAAIIPVGDALVVYIYGGTQGKYPLLLHSLGIVYFVVAGIWISRSADRE